MLIQLTNTTGEKLLVSPLGIVWAREAPTASRWDGTKSLIKTTDGELLYVQDTVTEIQAKLDEV